MGSLDSEGDVLPEETLTWDPDGVIPWEQL
jgi:hypothetical protein